MIILWGALGPLSPAHHHNKEAFHKSHDYCRQDQNDHENHQNIMIIILMMMMMVRMIMMMMMIVMMMMMMIVVMFEFSFRPKIMKFVIIVTGIIIIFIIIIIITLLSSSTPVSTISQPIIEILTQNFQELILGIYPVHQIK